jgi:hypothetical protein
MSDQPKNDFSDHETPKNDSSMNDRNGQIRDDLVDRATAALRATNIPAGPSPELIASTVEAMKSPPTVPAASRRPERKMTMARIVRYSGWTAAFVSVGVVAGWLILFDRLAATAFADVIEKVKNAKSVSFVSKIPTIIQGSKRGVLEQKFYIQGDSFRMEIPSAQAQAIVPPDAPPILMAMIADARQKKLLQLDYVGKTGQSIHADEKQWQAMSKGLANPIETLRRLKNDDAERLPDEVLNGKKTHVYRLKQGNVFLGVTVGKDDPAKLWVDPATGLPVKIAVGDTEKGEQFIIFEQFAWNQQLDPAMFSVELPAGFTVKEK